MKLEEASNISLLQKNIINLNKYIKIMNKNSYKNIFNIKNEKIKAINYFLLYECSTVLGTYIRYKVFTLLNASVDTSALRIRT